MSETIVRIGYVPYLNMAPFYRGFGPKPIERDGARFEFPSLSPRGLGQEAAKETIDAGPLSLVDLMNNARVFEPLGAFGIGVVRAAQSVLLFTKKPVAELARGVVAVTDETSTSVQLLKLLLEKRFGLTGVQYGRIASSALFDGQADGLLLIGDEALRAKAKGIRGFSQVTDLGESWFEWQGLPFVFARWAVRRGLPEKIKKTVYESLQNSLDSMEKKLNEFSDKEAAARGWTPEAVRNYWAGFAHRLTPAHEQSVQRFMSLLEVPCSIA